MKNPTLVVALYACLAAVPASAEDELGSYSGGQGWSVLAGKTMGLGATSFHAEVGWPGVSMGLLHGAASRFDLGGRLSLNYGYEGLVTQVVPGLKLQGVFRLMLLERGRLNLGLELAPGPFFYFWSWGTDVGLALPVRVAMGVGVNSALMLNLAMEMPMFVVFGPSGGVVLPVLLGGGLEYFIDSKLAATFRLGVGPAVGPGRSYVCYSRWDCWRYNERDVALTSTLGVSLKL